MKHVFYKVVSLLCIVSFLTACSKQTDKGPLDENLKDMFSISDYTVLGLSYNNSVDDTYDIEDAKIHFKNLIAYHHYFLLYGEFESEDSYEISTCDIALNGVHQSEFSSHFVNDEENHFYIEVYLKNQLLTIGDVLSITVNEVNCNGEIVTLKDPIIEEITIEEVTVPDEVESGLIEIEQDSFTIELSALFLHIESNNGDFKQSSIQMYDVKDKNIQTEMVSSGDSGGVFSNYTRFFGRAIDPYAVSYITIDDVKYYISPR